MYEITLNVKMAFFFSSSYVFNVYDTTLHIQHTLLLIIYKIAREKEPYCICGIGTSSISIIVLVITIIIVIIPHFKCFKL